MNKKFYGTLLLGTLLLGSTIVSCKDYDDDIDNLQNQITQLATKADMQSEVSKLQSAVATAQAAAENKAAAAEQAAKDAAAKAQAAADAAAKAQGTADAAATVEALEKVAAEAAAAAKAAEEAKAAAEAKAEELASQLAELQALAATLVSTEDFEAAKKELNDKYAELAAKIGETTGTTGMTGLSIVGLNPSSADVQINSGYGVWDGVHKGAQAATWSGTRALPAKGDYVVEFGKPYLKIAVNPTDLDLSNTEFAVVNQFGDVAPIAFGTPSVPTRALSAGVYELKYTSAALTSESVQAFSKSFADKGGTATLVAGNIAAQVTKNFVKIEQIKNGNKSTFSATVKYDEIANGTVEVKADDAQYVYDSYIEMLDDVKAHDSLVYKLVYSGKDMTLAYDAAAIKKAVDANKTDLTIKLQVKQINLNGYIHTVKGDEAKIVFKAKEAAKDVVKETVELSKVAEHTIALNVLDKATGKYPNAQKVNVDLKEAIEAWGLDDKKSDDYIHWSHGKVTESFGTAYYYDDNNDALQVSGLVSKVGLNDDRNILTIDFTEDYKYTGWNTNPSEDVVFSGKTIYIPVALTLKDDEDQESNTIYNVVVPVKFASPDLTKYYAWGPNGERTIKVDAYKLTDGGASPAPGAGIWDYLPAIVPVPAKTSTGTSNDVTLEWPFGTEVDKNGVSNGGDGYDASNIKYIVSSVKLSAPDFNTIPEYKKKVEEINALEDGATNTVDPTTKYYGTAYAKYNDDYKTAKKEELKKQYTNYVVFGYSGNYVLYEQPITDAKSNKYVWSSTYNAYTPVTTAPASTSGAHIVLNTTSVSENVKKALLNSTYTLSGFNAVFAGRKIAQSVKIEFTYNPAPSAALTISNNEYINEANAPALLFSNSKVAAKGTDAVKFDRTFTAVDKFNSALYLDDTSIGTAPNTHDITSNVAFEVVAANGIVHTTVANAPKVYSIHYRKNDGTTAEYAQGIKIAPGTSKMTYTPTGTATPIEVKAGDKIRVTIKELGSGAYWKRFSDDAQVNEAFTFELEVK